MKTDFRWAMRMALAIALVGFTFIIGGGPPVSNATTLEGDVEKDCQVDAIDAQSIAFRYGTAVYYEVPYDFEGSPAPDGDIDILDIQYVFGRFGSTCANPAPSAPSFTPQSVNIIVSPASQPVTAGGTASVSVSVNQVSGTGAAEIAIYYDQTLLEPQPSDVTSQIDPWGASCFDFAAAAAVARVGCSSIGLNSAITLTGTVVEFNFDVVQSGTAIFSLAGAQFGDPWGQKLYGEGTLPDQYSKALDTDGDGCTDQRENALDETIGGLRDYNNPWDFYDVETISGPGSDGVVDLLFDTLSVINHYSPAGAPPYDAHYDRGPSAGPNAWNMTAPDGAIDLLNDILGVVLQGNHYCT